MSENLSFKTNILINCPVDKVWDALTIPEYTRQYMFGCDVQSSWEEGSEINWNGHSDGVTYVTGKVLKFEPKKCLSFTAFNPHGDYENKPENHLKSEYTLEKNDMGTNLHVHQEGFSDDEGGKKRFEESAKSWEMALTQLKSILE